MYKCKMKAYEGKEKYLFISYAHKDSEKVFPILDELNDRGYRIWYDDGIAPGSEWPEYIAQHLNACAVCVAFITSNSIASPNCRREVTFALSKKKEFLGLILEPTEMSLGMELQLSAQQCVMRYNYDSQEKFIEKICIMPELQECKRREDEVVATATSVSTVATASAKAETGNKETVPQTASSQKTISADPAFKKIPKPVLFGGIGVAVLALILLLVLCLPKGGSGEDAEATKSSEATSQVMTQDTVATSQAVTAAPTEQITQEETKPVATKPEETKTEETTIAETGSASENEVETNADGTITICGAKISLSETRISGSNVTLEQKDILALSQLNKLSSITFSNCDFAGCDLSALSSLTELEEVSLENCSGIKDLFFLNECKNLYDVELTNCQLTDDQLKLSNCVLYTLHLEDNEGLSKLPDFDCSQLMYLFISNTGISDLSSLADAKDLSRIYGDNTPVSDISSLAGLKKISKMSFNNCKIETVTKDFHSLNMSELYISNNGGTDYSGFQYLSSLKTLMASDNQLTALQCLFESKSTLVTVDLNNNRFPEDYFSNFTDATALKSFKVSQTKMKDLNFLSASTQLETIEVTECGLTDISGITKLEKLTRITLYGNELTELPKFAWVTSEYKFVTFDVSNNLIVDLSNLPQCHYDLLGIHGNQVDYKKMPSAGLIAASWITADYNDTFLNLPELEKNRSYYYLLDCPLGKQKELSKLCSNRVKYGNVELLLSNWTTYGRNYYEWEEE